MLSISPTAYQWLSSLESAQSAVQASSNNQHNSQATAYVLCLSNIQHTRIPDHIVSQYGVSAVYNVRMHVSLYDTTTHRYTHTNTYISKHNINDRSVNYVYIHSDINDSNIMCVIEYIGCVIDDSVCIDEWCIGWTTAQLFGADVQSHIIDCSDIKSIQAHMSPDNIDQIELSRRPQHKQLYCGTPRTLQLLNTGVIDWAAGIGTTNIIATYQLFKSNKLSQVAHLLPLNQFVGPDDIIDGLGGCLCDPDQLTAALQSELPQHTLQITKPTFTLPNDGWESEVCNTVASVRNNEWRVDTRSTRAPAPSIECTIQLRSLHIGVHNGVRYISDVCRLPLTLSHDMTVLHFNGDYIIDSFICDLNDVNISLVCELMYQVQCGTEIYSICIGYDTCAINECILDNTPQPFELMCGPGHTISQPYISVLGKVQADQSPMILHVGLMLDADGSNTIIQQSPAQLHNSTQPIQHLLAADKHTNNHTTLDESLFETGLGAVPVSNAPSLGLQSVPTQHTINDKQYHDTVVSSSTSYSNTTAQSNTLLSMLSSISTHKLQLQLNNFQLSHQLTGLCQLILPLFHTVHTSNRFDMMNTSIFNWNINCNIPCDQHHLFVHYIGTQNVSLYVQHCVTNTIIATAHIPAYELLLNPINRQQLNIYQAMLSSNQSATRAGSIDVRCLHEIIAQTNITDINPSALTCSTAQLYGSLIALNRGVDTSESSRVSSRHKVRPQRIVGSGALDATQLINNSFKSQYNTNKPIAKLSILALNHTLLTPQYQSSFNNIQYQRDTIKQNTIVELTNELHDNIEIHTSAGHVYFNEIKFNNPYKHPAKFQLITDHPRITFVTDINESKYLKSLYQLSTPTALNALPINTDTTNQLYINLQPNQTVYIPYRYTSIHTNFTMLVDDQYISQSCTTSAHIHIVNSDTHIVSKSNLTIFEHALVNTTHHIYCSANQATSINIPIHNNTFVSPSSVISDSTSCSVQLHSSKQSINAIINTSSSTTIILTTYADKFNAVSIQSVKLIVQLLPTVNVSADITAAFAQQFTMKLPFSEQPFDIDVELIVMPQNAAAVIQLQSSIIKSNTPHLFATFQLFDCGQVMRLISVIDKIRQVVLSSLIVSAEIDKPIVSRSFDIQVHSNHSISQQITKSIDYTNQHNQSRTLYVYSSAASVILTTKQLFMPAKSCQKLFLTITAATSETVYITIIDQSSIFVECVQLNISVA